MEHSGPFRGCVAELPASALAPSEARCLLAAELAAAGILLTSPPAVDVMLVASELVTNAVVHARAPIEIRVEVDDHDSVRLSVVDGEPQPPVAVDRGPGDLGGWGIGLVDRIAIAWGVGPRPDGGIGKAVWAELPLG